MRRFFRNHGLSVVMLGLFFVTLLLGQVVSGRGEYNEDRREHGKSELSYSEYLRSSRSGEATAENWESEFLQMFVFVVGISPRTLLKVGLATGALDLLLPGNEPDETLRNCADIARARQRLPSTTMAFVRS